MKALKSSAYVDGSYNFETESSGSAVVLIINQNNRPHRIAFQRKYTSLKLYSSNISEMNAVKTAIKSSLSLGVTDLTSYYDWSGLEFFSHKLNIKPRHDACQCYKQYTDFIELKSKSMKINFVKVKAHSGVKFNTIADKMARVVASI